MRGHLAAAPISWGICEAPGWGAQLPPRRVLGEMRDLGITATELGSIGWLPTDAGELRALLDEFGLTLVGGFVPLVLHLESERDAARRAAREAAARLAGAGGECFVTAVVSSNERWERPALSAGQWASVFEGLDMVEQVCADFGLHQVLHPHVDTIIETSADMDRFLNHSGVSFCLDTGHLFIGGADPVLLARKHIDRIGLVHIKDVDMSVAERLFDDELTLMTATQAGLFPAAGQGDVPIAATIEALDDSGYSGWYVLEQDVALTGGLPPEGEGPVHGVRTSIEYLQSLAA
jgi:inosose dehydratase